MVVNGKRAVDDSSSFRIVLGFGSCGIAAGAHKTLEAVNKELKRAGLNPARIVKKTGCIGMCFSEPLLEIREGDDGNKRTIYGGVTPERAERIVKEHFLIKHGEPIKEWVVFSTQFGTTDDSFLKKQKRIVLRNCGVIDPEDISDYKNQCSGYKALEHVLKDMKNPEEVIQEVLSSGLKGRGGAGFPTGRKWKFTRDAPGTVKYIICNGDEGDPGAFMDRVILESDPHSVIEGMLIAGYAVGASCGYFYVREEYPLAIERLTLALKQARDEGFIGKNILGTDFSFDIDIKKGAGAFVCGEETALIASIEGRRGMPRLRPPFPAVNGLFGKPTVINNVKTLTNVPWILLHGAAEFSKIGTQNSPGTAVFALTGKIRRGGLVEVPMGTTLKEIIYDVGGGIKNDRKLKAVQTGGPSGGCIPERMVDTPVDYESLAKTGSIMGSGGMVVMDDATCMVDVARFFLKFTQNESCGKCTFCRIGTKRLLETLNRISEGKGKEGDLEFLEDLAVKVKASSLCGLGQTAPNPVLTTIKYFREEYESHIKEHKCPAGVCKALITFTINSEKCIGCGLCRKACPAGAISGELKKPFRIDASKCVKCGACIASCRIGAVAKK